VDVVVAGAGPAGCAVAIALARAGHDVLIADPCAGPAAGLKIGESLPAVALAALRDLGIAAHRVEAAGARRSTGISAVWGEARPHERDAIGDPHGHGWHLDRQRFDALLLEAACSEGARLRVGRVAAHTRDAGVRVRIGAAAVGCRWVVDATGRVAAVARALGARRDRADRLVAVYAAVRTPAGDVDARTLVQSTPSGWWYGALVAPQRRVVAFLTDADLLDRALATSAGFTAALAHAGHVLPHGSVELVAGPATTAAHGARLSHAHGTRWVAVGDAALAFDPLSSQGIANALVTGILAAAAVDACLRGAGTEPLEAYDERLAAVWLAYETHRAEAYAGEDRWPDEPFWARRRGAPEASRAPSGSGGWRTA
jgi:flavin-dependent dehydrogenase